ncbi:hypothetical protein DFH08DRAFT_1049982 [Mycena albidolilacea]|uniref:Reverse transcriptase domain-containing protein n=1 Tax=Mycena albidolilacea TaxID=1033008 RepID=A0AAD6Z6M5_9AGAR|nr:hypothetical protein DFH08DRAFT_1049982 [Mycena albidolilacea]
MDVIEHNILLAGIFITNLEQADDILISLTPDGAQRKMNALWKWCSINFMIINAIKSLLMILGSIPKGLPTFRFGNDAVTIVKTAKYVGLNLNSTKRNIFEDRHSKKASKVRAIAETLLGLESMVGVLPVWEARKLYMALVDPHLTHGCEISLDVDPDLLKLLEDVQNDFLRRILGLNKRSMTAPLFTETGLVPLRFRRVALALTHLRYLATLKADRYVRVASDDSVQLSDDGKASWAMNLRYVIHNLPFNIVLPPLSTMMVDAVIKSVNAGLRAYLQWSISDPNSPKRYLLRGRLEPEKDSAPIQKELCFRHYLSVVNPKRRKALTRLLLSSHCHALERLRWVEHRRPRIDRNLRLCRFCKAEIESPEHALLQCTASADLVLLRDDFLAHMNNDIKRLPALNSMPVLEFFTRMISYRHTISLVAKYAFGVKEIFESTPMLIPALPLQWMIQSQSTDQFLFMLQLPWLLIDILIANSLSS